MNYDQYDNEQIIEVILEDYHSTLEDAIKIKNMLDSFEPENYEYEERFKKMIDESHDVVRIMGIKFTPSTILEELDETAYRCLLNDYASQQFCDKPETSDEYCELEQQLNDLVEEMEKYKILLVKYEYNMDELPELE